MVNLAVDHDRCEMIASDPVLETPRPISQRNETRPAAGMRRVMDLTKSLAAERDFERLLDLIIREACLALDCERASLFLHDDEHQELYTRKVTRLDQIDEIRLPDDAGIVGMAAQDRRTVHIADPYRHPLFNAEFDKHTRFRTRNILCAPLISWSDGKLLGVLQLLNQRDGSFTDGQRELLETFASHAAIAIERAILTHHYEEKMRIEVALDLAREVQADFFPRELPKTDGYEMAATSRPADATGGDYYDVIRLKSGRLGLVVGDVCGHGLGPSLLMASVRAMLRGFVQREPAPADLLTDVNNAMSDMLCPKHRFITMLYGSLDTSAHRFDYANAGHGPVALHLPAGSRQFRALADDPGHGCPLGIMPEPYEACRSLEIESGDLLILGTDGVVETFQGRDRFGMERLCQLILDHRGRPVEDIVEEVLAATTEFHDSPRLDDDLTLIIVRRTS